MQSVEGAQSGQAVQRDESDQGVADVHSLPCSEEDRSDFLDVGEAAKALGASTMTVRRLYDARKLPGYRQGRTRKILRVFVDGFVAEIRAGRQPVLQDYADAWFRQAQEMAS